MDGKAVQDNYRPTQGLFDRIVYHHEFNVDMSGELIRLQDLYRVENPHNSSSVILVIHTVLRSLKIVTI